MGFIEAVVSVFSKYAQFEGRAPRSEFWWFNLFSVLVSGATSFIDGFLGFPDFGPAQIAFIVATLLPALAVSIRRLHDLNSSGWWYLIVLVPIVGALILTVWFILRGTRGPNDFGDDPLDLLAETDDPIPQTPKPADPAPQPTAQSRIPTVRRD